MATSTFTHSSGTNGFLVPPFIAMSSELIGLANGSVAVSSGYGTAGKFTSTNFGNAPQMYAWAVFGSSVAAPSAGANLTGWYVHSPDGGTSYEKVSTVSGLPRSPDFIIPANSTGAYAAAEVIYGIGVPPTPYDNCRIAIQNNLGVTLSTAATSIYFGPVADDAV